MQDDINEETESDHSNNDPDRFKRTRWSLIKLAIDADKPGAKEALNELGRAYYKPIRNCVHRWLVCHAQDAERTDDLCNEFFHKLLSRNKLADADPQRGKFRTYLRMQLEGFLHDQVNRYDKAQKRDVRLTVSHDATDEEGQALIEIVDSHSPFDDFDREFTRSLIANTMEQLRSQYESKGKDHHFAILSPYITASEQSSIDTLSTKLGITYDAVRAEAARLRKDWRKAIREAVAATLDNPTEEDIDAELAELMGHRKAERQGVQRSEKS